MFPLFAFFKCLISPCRGLCDTGMHILKIVTWLCFHGFHRLYPLTALNELPVNCSIIRNEGWWRFERITTKANSIPSLFFLLFQIHFRFRIGWRRSYTGNLYCDQSTISSNQLISFGGSWRATCANSLNPVCGSTTIGNTYFYCTDYSTTEDWTVGENNFTHTFSNSEKEWHVRYVHEGFSCFRLKLNISHGSRLIFFIINKYLIYLCSNFA